MSSKMKLDAKHILIIIGCMLLQAIPFGMAQNVQPLFIPELHKTFNFPMSEIGLIFTFGAVAASVISPIAGKFYDKVATKTVMGVGVIICGLGLLGNAFSSELWQFILCNAIAQIGCVTFSGLGVPYLIGTWFDKHQKATALGIAFAGGSIGNFFLQPFVSNLFTGNSVSKVYLICAISALVVGVLVILFMIKNRKDTVVEQADSDTTEANVVLKGIGSKRTMKLPLFWVLCSGMLFVGLNIAAQSTQYANFFKSLDISNAQIGFVGSTFAIACLLGNVGGGVIFSKFGVFKATFLAFILQLLSVGSMLVLGITKNMLFGYVWAVLYGITVFIYMSGPAVIMQDLFGMKESSVNLGIFSIFFSIGFALGNVVFGLIVDKAGFTAAWYEVIACIVVGFIIMLFAIKKIEKEDYAEAVITE